MIHRLLSLLAFACVTAHPARACSLVADEPRHSRPRPTADVIATGQVIAQHEEIPGDRYAVTFRVEDVLHGELSKRRVRVAGSLYADPCDGVLARQVYKDEWLTLHLHRSQDGSLSIANTGAFCRPEDSLLTTGPHAGYCEHRVRRAKTYGRVRATAGSTVVYAASRKHEHTYPARLAKGSSFAGIDLPADTVALLTQEWLLPQPIRVGPITASGRIRMFVVDERGPPVRLYIQDQDRPDGDGEVLLHGAAVTEVTSPWPKLPHFEAQLKGTGTIQGVDVIGSVRIGKIDRRELFESYSARDQAIGGITLPACKRFYILDGKTHVDTMSCWRR